MLSVLSAFANGIGPIQSRRIWRRNIYSKGNMMEIMLRRRWETKCLRFAHHSILGTSAQSVRRVYTKMLFTIPLNAFTVGMASAWKACLSCLSWVPLTNSQHMHGMVCECDTLDASRFSDTGRRLMAVNVLIATRWSDQFLKAPLRSLHFPCRADKQSRLCG